MITLPAISYCPIDLMDIQEPHTFLSFAYIPFFPLFYLFPQEPDRDWPVNGGLELSLSLSFFLSFAILPHSIPTEPEMKKNEKKKCLCKQSILRSYVMPLRQGH